MDKQARRMRITSTRVILPHQSVTEEDIVLIMYLGIDFVQEKFMGQGPQNNESAVEQAKDEQISDFSEYTPTSRVGEAGKWRANCPAVRGQYKSATGSDMPIKDKETRLG